jgi:hypothetical protein
MKDLCKYKFTNFSCFQTLLFRGISMQFMFIPYYYTLYAITITYNNIVILVQKLFTCIYKAIFHYLIYYFYYINLLSI